MEKKIKTLYILSIIAIVAFLGMQVYWLYARYEYSIRDYEDRTETAVADALVEYDKARTAGSATKSSVARIQSTYNMNHDVDSVGRATRKVSVTTKIIEGRELLGIKEDRKLTPEEMQQLEKIVMDSLGNVEEKRATLDVTNAPSDGAAWTAMKNFELEVQSPFTVEGIDSILVMDNIDADVSLIVTDSLTWKPTLIRHSSVISPRFKFISHYSELEYKAVVIDCRIPVSDVLLEMGRTLILAFVISLFLIICLVWQIKTIAKLTRLDRMRSMFVTTMIHELKRPISTLKMCVSGIENEKMLADKETKGELMSATRTALDNLSAYFSKLRDITFNKVEQIPLNITKFNLSRLVDDVIAGAAVPSFKSVRIDNRVGEDVEVSADRTHLFNMINNLVENAVKYSGENVDIGIACRIVDGAISISVTDNGHGIAASDMKHIFKRFYRGRATSADIPGMGLGLAYVKLLVDAHGGSVIVSSNPGQGSCFTINLLQ